MIIRNNSTVAIKIDGENLNLGQFSECVDWNEKTYHVNSEIGNCVIHANFDIRSFETDGKLMARETTSRDRHRSKEIEVYSID